MEINENELPNNDIPTDWIGKKARVLYDKPFYTPYKKGDIVKIVPADNSLAIMFGKQTMVQREGERTYSLPKYAVELVEDDVEVTSAEELRVGDKVRLKEHVYGCEPGDTGILVEPDLFAIMFGIEFLVKLDRTGETKAIEPNILEKVKELKKGSVVKMEQDDDWGAFRLGQKFVVVKEGEFLGIVDNDGEFRALDHFKYKIL
ncbi:hypothetical protein P9695_14810 [Weizmannia sp. CD-2023]|uniref:hypothetical protein n=1 Tax=Heyndrickxia TaxID=2837504 RepID=UPI002E24B03B|nr:hypothetical protein [Weizmannia sp. CD-2023]MED4899768.1 hypothetical protein [Weizmannia sp. CD-2023]